VWQLIRRFRRHSLRPILGPKPAGSGQGPRSLPEPRSEVERRAGLRELARWADEAWWPVAMGPAIGEAGLLRLAAATGALRDRAELVLDPAALGNRSGDADDAPAEGWVGRGIGVLHRVWSREVGADPAPDCSASSRWRDGEAPRGWDLVPRELRRRVRAVVVAPGSFGAVFGHLTWWVLADDVPLQAATSLVRLITCEAKLPGLARCGAIRCLTESALQGLLDHRLFACASSRLGWEAAGRVWLPFGGEPAHFRGPGVTDGELRGDLDILGTELRRDGGDRPSVVGSSAGEVGDLLWGHLPSLSLRIRCLPIDPDPAGRLRSLRDGSADTEAFIEEGLRFVTRDAGPWLDEPGGGMLHRWRPVALRLAAPEADR
jgi:hypothetical protein